MKKKTDETNSDMDNIQTTEHSLSQPKFQKQNFKSMWCLHSATTVMVFADTLNLLLFAT